ncbi:major head protein [Rhizobium phage RHph_N3_8]|uniref:major head protein n=1 Tax=Rhizobium phage RHph_N3_8 TaxID=2509748 RepID=UPI001AF9FC41|nr:major head protein [Rhizobium phage RHph_N3_8]QIG76011.1 major head protein [Rhizobium phage RHph_N3_8]
MAVSAIPHYKPSTNAQLLNALREGASPSYKASIPEVTKANIQKTIETLMEFPVLRNEFISELVNKIGLTIFKSKIWKNPLQEFKIDPLTWGAVIEEVQVGLLEAKVYDPDQDYMEGAIWGRELPPVQVAYHQVNRQNYYKLTVRKEMLERAFLNDFGLSRMVTDLMNSIYNSANTHEFELTCSLFAEYAKNGGFFKVNVPDVAASDSPDAAAKQLLRAVRSMAGNLEFFSTHYNASRLPTFAAPEDLVLFVSPEVKAAMDVNAFAAAFNIPYTDLPSRVITIPKDRFRIRGVQAILTTKDFFIIADRLMENREIQNPASLDHNYFFHVHQVISVSLFVPAIMFWTGPSDVIPVDTEVVTGISAITATYSQDDSDVTAGPLTRGELYIMHAEAETDPENGGWSGVKWSITGNNKNTTTISQTGNLQIGGNETANSITVEAVTTWIDPDGVMRDGEKATMVFILTGDLLPQWPVGGANGQVPTDIKVKGVSVPSFAPGTLTYTVEVGDGTLDSPADVVVVGVDGGGYNVTLNTAKDVATVEVTAGTDKTYTVTVNPSA